MKKRIATILTAIGITLVTSGFVAAEVAVTTTSDFPYFHLGSLIIAGLIITSLKAKYEKIMVSEAVGVFALYTLLVSFFTSPVINGIKNLVG